MIKLNKESLEELKDIIINGIDKSKTMNQLDKAELMINMTKIIESPEQYKKNIKVLSLYEKRKI